MGRMLLILLIGFAASFGILSNSKNRRLNESVDRVVEKYGNYSANDVSSSGAYMALHKLYKDQSWRTGYSNKFINGDTLNLEIEDNSVDPSLGPFKLRIRSTANNEDATDVTEVTLFNGSFADFAVWAKDSVTNVSTKDSLGNLDPSLLMENAPFMPDIDNSSLESAAVSQGQVQSGSPFTPADGYPNGSFYYSGNTPNVTHVQGDLQVNGGTTIYGIFIIEGNAVLNGNSRVEGVLYLPNPSTTVIYGGGSPQESSVTGGILTWGTVDGTGNHISVQHSPEYMNLFAGGYAAEDPPIRVLTWQ